MADNNIIEDVEKVEKESTTSKKYCEVLKFNERKKFIIVSFNGFGILFKNIKKDPGKKVCVSYKGKIGKSDFECELVNV